jgi:hypothetical protein
MANGFEIKLGEAFEFFTDIRRVPEVEQIEFILNAQPEVAS